MTTIFDPLIKDTLIGKTDNVILPGLPEDDLLLGSNSETFDLIYNDADDNRNRPKGEALKTITDIQTNSIFEPSDVLVSPTKNKSPLPILFPPPPGVLHATLEFSTGLNGINSRGLGLTGTGIGIGQVEVERPGKPGFDNPAKSHPNVKPTEVFLQNGKAIKNQNIEGFDPKGHATRVASVMISDHKNTHRGVAPGASLYSSAFVPLGNGQAEVALSAQHVAQQRGGDVRAINFSFGGRLPGTDTLNGNSLLTQFVDWSARQHDTLYVIAGNEFGGGIPLPTDEFNGVTVSMSRLKDGKFREVDPDNVFTEDAVGDRRSVDLVAPGVNLSLPNIGGGLLLDSGTSYAAPHVTGTVVLLQEFGDGQIAANKPNWDTDARRHEVMKAVLMNSADKVEGLLDMDKTIIDTNGKNWLDSDAATSRLIPLDDQMGTGQLNASRALTQFTPGEHDSFGSSEVPVIGWDWGVTLNAGDINKYVFDKPLKKDSYISATLAWDREVSLKDFGADNKPGTKDAGEGNGIFDKGEAFNSLGLTDLDLYLVPEGANNILQFIDSSISTVDSVEHLFFKIPEQGNYELWVHQQNEPVGDQFYGLAWWAEATPPHPNDDSPIDEGSDDPLVGESDIDILVGGGSNDPLVGGAGDDIFNLDADQNTFHYILGDGSDTLNLFSRGLGGDFISFEGIQFVDVTTVGTNTEFRLGDGMTDNPGFGTGDLLVTMQGTTGFTPANIDINVAFSNEAQFLFA
ncbi:MAG: S8 family serine peptidase [Cyanobacteria bacterium P01_G01_bin.49]